MLELASRGEFDLDVVPEGPGSEIRDEIVPLGYGTHVLRVSINILLCVFGISGATCKLYSCWPHWVYSSVLICFSALVPSSDQEWGGRAAVSLIFPPDATVLFSAIDASLWSTVTQSASKPLSTRSLRVNMSVVHSIREWNAVVTLRLGVLSHGASVPPTTLKDEIVTASVPNVKLFNVRFFNNGPLSKFPPKSSTLFTVNKTVSSKTRLECSYSTCVDNGYARRLSTSVGSIFSDLDTHVDSNAAALSSMKTSFDRVRVWRTWWRSAPARKIPEVAFKNTSRLLSLSILWNKFSSNLDTPRRLLLLSSPLMLPCFSWHSRNIFCPSNQVTTRSYRSASSKIITLPNRTVDSSVRMYDFSQQRKRKTRKVVIHLSLENLTL